MLATIFTHCGWLRHGFLSIVGLVVAGLLLLSLVQFVGILPGRYW